MAKICRRIYALEIQEKNLGFAYADGMGFPENLSVQCGDARCMPFPEDMTNGVLLMRHCNQDRLYADKLIAVGVKDLITNARWRSGVEVIHLQSERIHYWQIETGRFACGCGAVGF